MAGQCAGQWYLKACGIGGHSGDEEAVSDTRISTVKLSSSYN